MLKELFKPNKTKHAFKRLMKDYSSIRQKNTILNNRKMEFYLACVRPEKEHGIFEKALRDRTTIKTGKNSRTPEEMKRMATMISEDINKQKRIFEGSIESINDDLELVETIKTDGQPRAIRGYKRMLKEYLEYLKLEMEYLLPVLKHEHHHINAFLHSYNEYENLKDSGEMLNNSKELRNFCDIFAKREWLVYQRIKQKRRDLVPLIKIISNVANKNIDRGSAEKIIRRGDKAVITAGALFLVYVIAEGIISYVNADSSIVTTGGWGLTQKEAMFWLGLFELVVASFGTLIIVNYAMYLNKKVTSLFTRTKHIDTKIKV